MALRQLRVKDDPILFKTSRTVTKLNDRLNELIDDMFETMYENDGVGLAAVQVGVLRRIVVIDIGDGVQRILINPELLEFDGEQEMQEGCPSVPGKVGKIKRPFHVKIKAQDRDMKEHEYEATGFLAEAFCHEIDHTNGILYDSKVEGDLIDVSTLYGDEGDIN